MSLKNQVAFGIKWASVSLVMVRATRFITSVILARLLAPEMFGIVAMANVAIDTIGVIRQVGFGSAYIYRHFDTDRERQLAENTIFFVTTAFSVLLFLACFFLSTTIAGFFKSPELESILKVMVLTFLLDPLATLPDFVLLKRLQFGKQSKCEIAQAASHALVGVSLAVMGCGVWSLVFAQLTSRLVFGIAVSALSRWRPQWEFSTRIARELFGYSKFLWACSFFAAVGSAFDRALIGRFWGAVSLGYYYVGFNLARLPAEVLSNMFGKISFPAFSKLNKERERLKNAVMRTISTVTFLAAPVGFGLFAVSGEFVAVVYGEKWLPSIPLLRVLAFFGLVQCVSPITGNVLKAIGTPKVLLYLSVFHHALLIGLLILLKGAGAVGICYAMVIAVTVSSVVAFGIIIRMLGIRLGKFLDPLVRSIVAAGIMAGAVKALQAVLAARGVDAPILVLVLSVLLGVFTYAGASFLINRNVVFDFKESCLGVLTSTGAEEKEQVCEVVEQ